MTNSTETTIFQASALRHVAPGVAAAPGRVVWITGLSGAGKSTVGRLVAEGLRHAGTPAVLLDGDDVRQAIQDPHIGHDRESRLTNAMRICRFAKLVSEQGLTVVAPTMSLFKEVYAWNRRNLPGYCEVLLRVPLEVLRRRDARGLYSRADRGEAQHVVGIHVSYDEPDAPHLVLENHGPESEVRAIAARILEHLQATQRNH